MPAVAAPFSHGWQRKRKEERKKKKRKERKKRKREIGVLARWASPWELFNKLATYPAFWLAAYPSLQSLLTSVSEDGTLQHLLNH